MSFVQHPGDMPGGHSCWLRADHTGHGIAIDECSEDTWGRLWVSNGEYGSQVFFCPVCGMKAPTPPSNTLPGATRNP